MALPFAETRWPSSTKPKAKAEQMTRQTNNWLIEEQGPTSCAHTVDAMMEQRVKLPSLTQTAQAPSFVNPLALAA